MKANRSYTVLLTDKAQKDLIRLKDLQPKALTAIRSLAQYPNQGHLLKGSLAGYRSLEFSMPGGAYRAAYYVDEEKEECTIFLVGPHEGFYKIAERRAKSLPKE